MKIVQVVPRPDASASLKSLLKAKERDLRGTNTTFVRQREGRWSHKTYPGWIKWNETLGGILVAEVKTKVDGEEWKLLQAFIGYLDRHFEDEIQSVSITYVPDA